MTSVHQITSQLRLVLYDGEDPATGKGIYRNKNFNAVKTSATADQLYAVAAALVSLQQRPLQIVERIDRAEIHEN